MRTVAPQRVNSGKRLVATCPKPKWIKPHVHPSRKGAGKAQPGGILRIPTLNGKRRRHDRAIVMDYCDPLTGTDQEPVRRSEEWSVMGRVRGSLRVYVLCQTGATPSPVRAVWGEGRCGRDRREEREQGKLTMFPIFPQPIYLKMLPS